MFVCINGKFLLQNNAVVSAFDNGFLYGDGVYETMRTYQGVIFELDIHLSVCKVSKWDWVASRMAGYKNHNGPINW